MTNIIIKHDIDKIFECKDSNMFLVPELEKYYINKNKKEMSILPKLIATMKNVSQLLIRGNSGDTTMKNTIRENLNKLNNANYDEIINILNNLTFETQEQYKLLANEILLKGMNDIMGYKGFNINDKLKIPSELYIDIVNKFSEIKLVQNNKEIKFKNVFLNLCNEYFINLTNINERMDKNNPHRVSNFKGLMNMIGLLFNNNLVDDKIIRYCCDKILNLVLYSKLSQDESDNYYMGYERLLNIILLYFEKQKNKNKLEILTIFKDFNTKITSALTLNETKKPIRMSAIIMHKQNISRIDEL